MRVLMLLSNSFRPDPRVYKEAKALLYDNRKVRILAWDRECKLPEREMVDGIEVYRIRVRSRYGMASDFFKDILRFYMKAINSARKMDFDAIHAHDFDTLPLGIILSKLHNVPLIYDVHDDYGSMITESVPDFFMGFIDRIQRTLARFPTAVIYASEAFVNLVGRNGELVLNCKNPEEYTYEKERDESLKIVYIGIFRQKKFLTSLIDSVKDIEDYSLILGGDGPLKDYVLKRIEGEERIQYIGWVRVNEIPGHTANADVIVILNDPNHRYDRNCVPVKLCEAMAAGVPVVVSESTQAERMVKECDCGLSIPFGDTDALKRALLKLTDESLRKRLGKNGLECAIKKYNERGQMKNLLKVYQKIS